MSYRLRGEIPTEWQPKIMAALDADYDRRDFWGCVYVELDYNISEKRFRVRAQLETTGVGVVYPEGGDLPAPHIEDYTAHLRVVLEQAGVPLA